MAENALRLQVQTYTKLIAELEAALRDLVFVADDGLISAHDPHYIENHLKKHPILSDVLKRG